MKIIVLDTLNVLTNQNCCFLNSPLIDQLEVLFQAPCHLSLSNQNCYSQLEIFLFPNFPVHGPITVAASYTTSHWIDQSDLLF